MEKTIEERADEYAKSQSYWVTTYDTSLAKHYIAGATEQKAIDEWHPATEHPEQDLEVIVMRYDCSCDSLVICFAHIVDKAVAVDYDGWNIPDVKCWMYCPELPKYE